MAHRFDGLDLLTTLVGLSCLFGVAWYALHALRSHREDTEPSCGLSWAPKYMAGLDYGAGSRPEAQMMLYQYLVDPEHPYVLVGASERQAESVHDEIQRMWIEHGIRILPEPPYDWAQDPDA